MGRCRGGRRGLRVARSDQAVTSLGGHSLDLPDDKKINGHFFPLQIEAQLFSDRSGKGSW
jgi:hypothetical protein